MRSAARPITISPRNGLPKRRINVEDLAFSPMSPEESSPFSSSGSDFWEGKDTFSSGTPDIAHGEIKRGKLLKGGSFGQVYAGMCRGVPVAIKVLNEKLTEKAMRQFREEIAIHKRLFHPNIVLLMGASVNEDAGELIIVEELMHKDLDRILYDQSLKLSLSRLVGFGRQAALGMNWLHRLDPPIVHRDLKPGNCLLDRELQHLKICDFGLSSIVARDTRTLLKESFGAAGGVGGGNGGVRCGTLNYAAPEVLVGEEATPAADIYAFGIILWQILTRERPYEDDVGDISFDSFTDFVADGARPHLEDSFRENTPTLVELIEDCWDEDPLRRPDFEEVAEILSDACVEIAVPNDLDAQRFWLKFFPTAEYAKVDRIIKAFCKWNRKPTNKEMWSKTLRRQLTHFAMLLHEKDGEEVEKGTKSRVRVSCEWFGRVIDYFGPFDDGFLDRVSDVCSLPYFHGQLSTPQSQRMLNGRSNGFFLLRFSSTEPGFFTVSVSKMGKGKVTHFRIQHKPCTNQYVVGGIQNPVTYKSISALIEGEKKSLGLSQPCPGSRFAPVDEFDDDEEQTGYVYHGPK